jgi:predicted Zn finger-like uncharacterized protein
MLYTRCPECETTFRITEGALQQARGQVRCGRCTHIFDAHQSLTDRLPDTENENDVDVEVSQGAAAPASSAGSDDATEAERVKAAASGTDDDPPGETLVTEPAGGKAQSAETTVGSNDIERASAPIDTTSLESESESESESEDSIVGPSVMPAAGEQHASMADITAAPDDAGSPGDSSADESPERLVAEPVPAADSVSAAPDESVMSADEIEAVLKGPLLGPSSEWLDGSVDAQPRSKLWVLAACLALVALGLQGIHQFRSSLARNALFGPVLQGTYALFGHTLIPDWSVDQYELLDWVAVEDGGQQSQRNLIIRSRLRNGADYAQPYPLVHLRLLNRWEEAVGARLFSPDEYMDDASSDKLMGAGEVVAAELILVDPGADTYGFELAVCVELEPGIVCDTDATFR